ncbi:MAG: VanZ family protein [Gemmatimonadetes bacterium]|nr:VanZ family protein [Gemmatimonadota bacterium]
MSAIPGQDGPPTFFPGEDKVAHLILYGGLGAALAWGRSRVGASAPGALALWAAGVLYGASDELHQAFVPGRHVSLGDLAADAAGVALGYWLSTRFLGRSAAKPSAPPTL